MTTWAAADCERCGAPLGQPTTGRPRRFCSNACKQMAYRVTKVNRKGYNEFEGETVHVNGLPPSPATPGKPRGQVTP